MFFLKYQLSEARDVEGNVGNSRNLCISVLEI